MKGKIWLTVALATVVIAAVLSLSSCGNKPYDTSSQVIDEQISTVSIVSEISDIYIVPSEDGVCRVTSSYGKKFSHSVEVRGDSLLSVELSDEREWYDYIGIFNVPKIIVALPAGEYEGLYIQAGTGDVACCADAKETMKIVTSTGDIAVEDVTAGSVELLVSTGDVELSNVSCAELTMRGSTGEAELDDVTVTGKLTVKRSTGDITLERVDAGEILIETSTGDIEGSLLTDKIFVARSNTGRVRVPETVTGGVCKLTTNTGSITITIAR